MKGIPNLNIDLKKKRKKKVSTDQPAAQLIRRVKSAIERKARREKTRAKTKSMQAVVQPIVENVPIIRNAPALTTSRFDKLVERVTNITDIAKLKKMIYNRNYRLTKKFNLEHPEQAAERQILKFPPVVDIRVVGKSAFSRLSKIKNSEKLLQELRKLIINTTRRRNVPQTTGDYSNKEQDYLADAVDALKSALSNWTDDVLSQKLAGAFNNITMADISKIFSGVPSYWAISSGFYYAIADFDDFMQEIFTLIRRDNVILTKQDEAQLTDRLFKNDPRDNK